MSGERVYDLLPVPLQNMAVSIKGWQFHRARYLSASFCETARTLERNEQLSFKAMKELQFSMFREFAMHCFAKSPYYRHLWESRGLHPSDIRNPSDARLVPIVDQAFFSHRVPASIQRML